MPGGRIGRAFRSEEVLPVYPRGEGELPGPVRERLGRGSLFRGCQRSSEAAAESPGGGGVQHNCTMVKFDDRSTVRSEGYYSCLLILFMVFLLSFGSWLFTVIAKRLAVEPIERMLAVVDIVSISLHSFQRDGNKYGESKKKKKKKKKKKQEEQEKQQKKKKKKNRERSENKGEGELTGEAYEYGSDGDDEDGSDDDDEEDEDEDEDEFDTNFETGFLEEAVLKMAELLHMGYGAAGTEIIQRNLGLSDGMAVETFIAGKRLDACFAFCDIRKFTDTTEVGFFSWLISRGDSHTLRSLPHFLTHSLARSLTHRSTE